MPPFDIAPTLTGTSLDLRPLTQADFPDVVAAASDPLIWEQHPAKDRWRPEVATPYVSWLLDQGGTMVARRADEVVGISRFYPCPEEPGAWGIGFTFLVRAVWGGATNREMKDLMLAHAFEAVDVIWFHIAPGNLRSQKGTEKIGARYVNTMEWSPGGGLPARATQRWRLTREDWAKREDWARARDAAAGLN